MKSAIPKHLHPLLGRRLVDWVIEAVRPLGAEPLVVVVSADAASEFEGVAVAVQPEPLGTGDAARAARGAVGGAETVLVVSGDHPLLTPTVLRSLVDQHRSENAAATVLSFEPGDARAYGRIVRDADGALEAIVEAADASEQQLAVREVNSSIYVFDAAKLWPALDRLQPVNAQGELYLTDAIEHIVAGGGRAAAYVCPDPIAPLGINTRAELATAAAVLRDRVNEAHMLAGVTIVDPASTWIEAGVELEADTVVHPFTVLRGTTKIAAGAEIGPHTVLLDAVVGPGASVGPFCYLRPGTVLEAGARAGTFVEIKESRIGERSRVPHLSYVGDAEIGEDTNIAAGAITANYRPEVGPGKQRTKIGRNVRTGSDNVFVAPVEIGDNAVVGAGSVVTEDVPPGALAIARARQVNKENYARGKRDD